MADGLALMEHVISNAKVDTDAYDKYLDRLAKSRDNTKTKYLVGRLDVLHPVWRKPRLRNVQT